MKEKLLQFMWKHQLFDRAELRTDAGMPLTVMNVGLPNFDAGPDFFNARLQIGDTVWCGNVEVHLRASDWYRHNHHNDAAYDNVTLHVVADNDRPTFTSRNTPVPTLQLTIPDYLRDNFEELQRASGWIPCIEQFRSRNPMSMRLWFHSLMVERLQLKTGDIIRKLQANDSDWNQTFYLSLAKNFGFKTNALPFEMLATNLPFNLVEKHRNNLFQLEALLFGTAGMLDAPALPSIADGCDDDYIIALRQEFGFLRQKYGIKPVGGHLWKFLRLRPVNFPTIRIAQFAALMHRANFLFSTMLETENLKTVAKLFRLQASEYWDTHYRFNKIAPCEPKHFGDTSFQNVVINTLAPFLFVYGEYYGKDELKDRALTFLENLPPEINAIIDKWRELGIDARSAFDSQALLQLKNEYCTPRKCLDCQLGVRIVKDRKNM
ncbi:MAG: DUF2851 family protein [Bacteroidales bacterium]|jgi:hypothetical protein|nr:DUF2851 family protein [Bacteroidales bacterium]